MQFALDAKVCWIGNTCTIAIVVASALHGNCLTMHRSFHGQGGNKHIPVMYFAVSYGIVFFLNGAGLHDLPYAHKNLQKFLTCYHCK